MARYEYGSGVSALVRVPLHREVPLKYMSFVTGVVVRGKVIELNQYVGQVIDTPATHEASSKVNEKAEAIYTKIEEQARALDLEIRAGMFEPQLHRVGLFLYQGDERG